MVSRVGIVLHCWEGVWPERGSRAAKGAGVMVLAHAVVRLVKRVVLRGMVLSVTNGVVSVLLQLDKGRFAHARGRTARGVWRRGLLRILLLLLLLLLHGRCSRRGGRVVLQRVGHAGLAAAAC